MRDAADQAREARRRSRLAEIRPGGPGPGRRAAGAPRPPLRLRASRRRWPGTPCPGRGSRCGSPGQDVDGFVLERAAALATTPAGSTPLRRVVSAEPVLAPEIAAAHRPDRRPVRRHPLRRAPARGPAAARDRREAAVRRRRPPSPVTRRSGSRALGRPRARRGLPRPPGGRGVAPGGLAASPRAATGRRCSPQAAAAAYASGRGVAGLRPRPQDVDARRRRAGPDAAGRRATTCCSRRTAARARATATSWPSARGARRIVVGTRSAAFAPVHDLGLVVDLGRRRRPARRAARAVPPHPRGAAAARRAAGHRGPGRPGSRAASRRPTSSAPAGPTRSWRPADDGARPGDRAGGRRHRPGAGPRPATPAGARLPDRGLRGDPRRRSTSGPGARADPAQRLRPQPGLRALPRRRPAARRCTGPLRARGPTAPPDLPLVRHRRGRLGVRRAAATGGCGRRCRGDARTAEELGRDLPADRDRQRPAATRCRATVGDHREIVVATPGAEPVAEGGYAAVVLLDTWLTLARADLRTDEEALRRWLNAAALARPGRPRGRRRRPGPAGAAGAGALGPGRLRRARAARPALRRTAAAGSAAGHDHRRAPAPSTTSLTLVQLPAGGRGARAGPARRGGSPGPGDRSGGPSSGCRGRRGWRSRGRSGRCSGCARRASSTPSGSTSTRALSRLVVRHVPAPEEPALPIQPIRLFGDPVLRSRGDRGRRLRQGAAHPGQGPDRHDARRARRRAGRAADRRRAAGVHLVRRRRGGPPGQPRPRPVRGDPGRSRGVPVAARSVVYDCRRALSVVAQGFDHARRAGDDRGHPSCSPARSSTRPTTSTACSSSTGSTPQTRKAAMKQIRESDWFGVEKPTVKVSPARHPRPGSADAASSSPAPPRSRCPRWTPIAASGHELVGVVTRPDAPTGRGRRLVAVAGRPAGRRARACPVLKPEHPARPRLPGGAARRCAPDCCPVVAYGALLPAVGARRSPRSAGSTCTSPACPPGAAPRRCSTRSGPATRSPAPPPSGSSETLDAGPTFGVMTERIRARPTPPATCWPGSPRAAPGCWCATLDGIADGTHRGPPAARGRAEPAPPRSPSRTPGSTGRAPRSRSTARSGPARPAPGAWSTHGGRADQARAGARIEPGEPARPLGPGELAVEQGRGARRHRHRPGAARRGARPSARSRCRPPTGPAGSGWTRTPGSVTLADMAVTDDAAPRRSRTSGPRPPTTSDAICACRCPRSSSAPRGGTADATRCPAGDKGKGFLLYRRPHQHGRRPRDRGAATTTCW